jgi:hypothetical protein
MQKPIKDASGKVLTIDYGMGYCAYMIALNDNVEHVIIIGFVYMIILEEFYKNQDIDAPKVSDLPDD